MSGPPTGEDTSSGLGAGALILGILLYILFVSGLGAAQLAWGDFLVNKQPVSVTPATAEAESVGRKTFVNLRGSIRTAFIKDCDSYVLAPVVAEGWDERTVTVLARIYDAEHLPDPESDTAPLVVELNQTGYLYAIDGEALASDYEADTCSHVWNYPGGERPELSIAPDAYVFRINATPPAPSLFADGNFWGALVLLALTGVITLGWWAGTLVTQARRHQRSVTAQLGAWSRHLQEHRLIYLKTFGYMAITSTLGGIYALVSEQVIYGVCVVAAANYLLLWNPFFNRQRMQAFYGMIGDLLLFGAVGVVLSLYGVLGEYGGALMFGLGFVYLIASTASAYRLSERKALARYDRLSLYSMEYATAVAVFALGAVIRGKIAPPDWEGAAAASALGFLALLLFLHGPYLMQSARYDSENFSVAAHRTIALTVEGFVFYAFYQS